MNRLVFRILDLYYNEELSQEIIARKFHISRSTVSRILTKAKKDGYVNISINYPTTNHFELEKKLEKKFNLQEAVIADIEQESFMCMAVSHFAADYIGRIIQENMKISMAWGSTLRGTLDYMENLMTTSKKMPKNIKIIPLLGSPNVNPDPSNKLNFSNILVKNMGRILNAESFCLSAPMIVENKNIKGVMESEKQISYILEMGKNCDIAIVGIGAVDRYSSLLLSGLVTTHEQEELKALNICGDVIGRYYDVSGSFINTQFDDRIIGIKISDYMKIPIRTGIAYGSKKVKSITAALKGGVINVIVTDSITANMVLKEVDIEG